MSTNVNVIVSRHYEVKPQELAPDFIAVSALLGSSPDQPRPGIEPGMMRWKGKYAIEVGPRHERLGNDTRESISAEILRLAQHTVG